MSDSISPTSTTENRDGNLHPSPHGPDISARAQSPRVLFALVLAYPLLTHAAVYWHSLALTAAAATLLLLVALRGALSAGRYWAWITLAGMVGIFAWLAVSTGRHDALFALYAAPVMIYLFLAWLFGRTLLPGSDALISQMAAHLHGQTSLTEPGLLLYTRRLTGIWTGLFLLLAAINALLATLASPDGVLELLGLASPWPVPPTAWSLFANVGSFAMVMLLFAVEFGYRRRRFPEHHARYRGLLDFLKHLREAMPSLMGSSPLKSPSVDGVRRSCMEVDASLRGISISLLILLQVMGVILIVWGAWAVGGGLIILCHLAVLWGSLIPGSAMFGPVVRRFSTDHKEVWLTIDDGPSVDTDAMLALLEAHRAKATFFLVGCEAAVQPDRVRRIAGKGHGIGNHTEAHSSAWFWAALPATVNRQIGAAQHTLSRLSGEPPQLFRAVVGMANPFVDPNLRRHGLLRVSWTARGFDAVVSDPEKVWRRLRRGLRPGAILLLHEGAAHGGSVAVLAHVLQQLDSLGYRCVVPEICSASSATTSQLLNGVPPHKGANRTSSPA